jgi:hypothetical protein
MFICTHATMIKLQSFEKYACNCAEINSSSLKKN